MASSFGSFTKFSSRFCNAVDYVSQLHALYLVRCVQVTAGRYTTPKVGLAGWTTLRNLQKQDLHATNSPVAVELSMAEVNRYQNTITFDYIQVFAVANFQYRKSYSS